MSRCALKFPNPSAAYSTRRTADHRTRQEEAIELSKIKIPRDIWARVALSEIIPRTDFRRDDVVQRSPISWSYLGYWAYRIYIGEWSDRYWYIYIFFSSGGGRRLPVKPYFFLCLYFPQATLLKDVCILLVMIFEHIFYSNTSLAFPTFIRLQHIHLIFSIRDYEYMPFVNHHFKFKNRLIKCTHIV